jgi:hypothetical protein
MSRYLLVAALVAGFAVPAVAAKARHDYDRCKIVNIAPYYTKTTIRRGKRVFITRETADRDMAIICP